MLLSRVEREFVTLGEELELLDAYLDVVRAPTRRPSVPVDVPRLTDAVDELVPAMLLPTLAAALHGEMVVVRMDLTDDRLQLAVRSKAAPDHAALIECFDRLHNLYDGVERSSIETDDSGGTIVELDLPRKNHGHRQSLEIYDLASA
jgi:hypothetical protein